MNEEQKLEENATFSANNDDLEYLSSHKIPLPQ
jgi:hypothetical protein